MFSIQKLFGRDGKFYDLLEASAQQPDRSVYHLIVLLEKLEQNETPEHLEEFAHSRRQDKRITQELTEQLSKTFATPLEREDIQELATALYKIPKTVEKIGELILICPQDLRGHSFQKQVELLDQAAETVLAMVKQLRKGIDASTAREMNTKLQGIEGDADKLELDRLRDLFQGKYEAKQIIFLRDLFLLFLTLYRFTPHFVNKLFGKLQIFSAAWMAHSHGSNDAQKTMGIIALALFTGTKAGSFDHLPGFLTFLKTPTFILPVWVVVLCAVTMAVGTAAGGWRIIRTQ